MNVRLFRDLPFVARRVVPWQVKTSGKGNAVVEKACLFHHCPIARSSQTSITGGLVHEKRQVSGQSQHCVGDCRSNRCNAGLAHAGRFVGRRHDMRLDTRHINRLPVSAWRSWRVAPLRRQRPGRSGFRTKHVSRTLQQPRPPLGDEVRMHLILLHTAAPTRRASSRPSRPPVPPWP